MVSATSLPRPAPALPVLHRTAFTMSRALEFFTEKELSMQLGFPQGHSVFQFNTNEG